MSTTLVQHVLDDTSKTPTAKVQAFLDHPPVGVVTIDGTYAIQSRDPDLLFSLADAALKAASDLEQQIAVDRVAQALAVAKATCQATRWPEHHRDDCLWCAHLAESLPQAVSA